MQIEIGDVIVCREALAITTPSGFRRSLPKGAFEVYWLSQNRKELMASYIAATGSGRRVNPEYACQHFYIEQDFVAYGYNKHPMEVFTKEEFAILQLDDAYNRT